MERVMRWNFASMLDRAIIPMPVPLILVAGALAKTGHPDLGLAWATGLCALLVMADLLKSDGQKQPAL
jgi:hypothetical protein